MSIEEKQNMMEVAERMEVLWNLLPDDKRRYLANNMEVRVYEKNETIYSEHEHPEYLMCLLDGKVKVFKEGVGGRNQIVRMVHSEGFFGYRAAFVGDDYCTSAAAFEHSTICMIPLHVIKNLLKDNYELALYFIRQLAMMLGDADTLTVTLTQKHIRGRLAQSLISLEDTYGVEEDGSTLNIYLSREDLASMSNMTTSNAIRTLSSFAQDNLIAIDGRKIKIIKDSELRKISQDG